MISYTLSSQSISSKELSMIEGRWAGHLTYVDYKDDVSKSTIKCKMDAQWKKNKGILTVLFTEPDGRVIKDKNRIKLKKDGSQVVFNDKYEVINLTKNVSDKSWELILLGRGKDNNKSAELKRIITLSEQEFVIKKMIKYIGEEHFFERNRYTFRREE